MLKSICYRSSLNKELSILETEHLFDVCKKNNDSLNLKGLLYKCDSCFFQIIEGPKAHIDALYTKIKSDKRHKDIKVLLNQPIKEFTFSNFTTGYSNVEELDTIFGLQEYHFYMETLDLPLKEEFLEIMSNLFSVDL
ncbi:BLUF domain-containing protein [Lacinutrix jangbogonensis]|uniref:BLUF domain-containing protein n=1 Tax=Lacinutrix jangbogonensis TaxID=1469557 RepID=UPI00053DC236|nr:BLUF domain-containing protein [Lacinutrix jangbogonensis]